MALWNAPRNDPCHAENACLAALRARRLTARLAAAFPARGWPALPTRFGIHTDEAVVGNVGSSDRMSYTAIGAMVNLASRLESLNRVYGTQILVSERTRRSAGAGFVSRPVDLVIPKGTHDAIEIHELLGTADADGGILAVDPDMAGRLADWQAFMAAYRSGDLDAARNSLRHAGDPASDRLAAVYHSRLAALPGKTPPPDWSPAIRFTEK
jgi:adenylate cyclase